MSGTLVIPLVRSVASTMLRYERSDRQITLLEIMLHFMAGAGQQIPGADWFVRRPLWLALAY